MNNNPLNRGEQNRAPIRRGKLKSWLTGMFVAALISSNVATLLFDQIHAAAFGVISNVLGAVLPDVIFSRVIGSSSTQKYRMLTKSNAELKANIAEIQRITAKRADVASGISRRVALRAARNAAKNVGSVAAEVVPVLGVAAMLALTASDLYDDCQTLKDMNELNVTFGQSKHVDEITVCGLKVPGLSSGASEVSSQNTSIPH